MGQPRVQVFTNSSGNGQDMQQPFPALNINNTNNIHMNMGRSEDPFAMLQGLMGGMPRMYVFNDGEEEQHQNQGVSEEFLDNLPPMKAGKEADCNICLEKVGTNDEKSCELPCGHAFDKSCLSTWLKEHDSCPVCRSKLDQER